jgi:hypothetical protein
VLSMGDGLLALGIQTQQAEFQHWEFQEGNWRSERILVKDPVLGCMCGSALTQHVLGLAPSITTTTTNGAETPPGLHLECCYSVFVCV